MRRSTKERAASSPSPRPPPRQAREAGLLAGACERASSGCASDDPTRRVSDAARSAGVPLLADMDGHAGIEPFVREGFELVVV